MRLMTSSMTKLMARFSLRLALNLARMMAPRRTWMNATMKASRLAMKAMRLMRMGATMPGSESWPAQSWHPKVPTSKSSLSTARVTVVSSMVVECSFSFI